MKKIAVLVTGVGGSGIGGQILKALKMSSLSLHIIGTDTTELSTGFKEVHEFNKVPLANDPEYIPMLLKICEKAAIEIIFPGSEPELKVISKNRQTFIDAGIVVPINTESVIDICLDKFKTNKFLAAHGFFYPKTISVTNLEDLPNVDFYPVIIKPNTGGSGSNGVMIAQNKYELNAFVSFLLNISTDLVIQEYIGDAESEYTVGVISSLEGELINSIAVHRVIENGLGNKLKVKNNTGKTALGKNLVVSSGISQGTIGKFPEVTKQCEEIAKKLESKGPLNIQCRLVDGKVFVFEINPRYSGTTPLRAMVGFNEPEIMIRKYILRENIEKDFLFPEKIIMRTLKEVML
ncbi:MAG: ATP-grasp domain-containing protein [Ferruginibacter sp.]|nr:ATP-grasp domain-containing protein [Ferruginibacter sp.]